MAGPFPGMDPYLELQAAWTDFHNGLIAEIRNELGASLPDSYVARVDERIEVATWALEPPRSFRPDVLVGRFEKREVSSGVALATAPATTLEPKLVEILDRDPEEVRITWVEIRALPDQDIRTERTRWFQRPGRDFDPLVNPRDIGVRKPRAEFIADFSDQAVMKVRPSRLHLDVGINPRKCPRQVRPPGQRAPKPIWQGVSPGNRLSEPDSLHSNFPQRLATDSLRIGSRNAKVTATKTDKVGQS